MHIDDRFPVFRRHFVEHAVTEDSRRIDDGVEGAKDTTGQVFAVRGNEVFLFNQPRPVRARGRIEGWTPQTLIEQALPALKANYTDAGASASVFPYDPV